MPPTNIDRRRVARQFLRIKKFPRVIGAIDGKINNVFCLRFGAIIIINHFIYFHFE